ncbi:MAG: HK97 family phage prohead protease [Pirellulales bacterium]|nr:HK97 family phage prohead protease [Pirellulales bacterium]
MLIERAVIGENRASLHELLLASEQRMLHGQIALLEKLKQTPESDTLKCRSLRARIEILNAQYKCVEETIARRKSDPTFFEKRICRSARFTMPQATAAPAPTYSRNADGGVKRITGYGAVFYDPKIAGTEFELCPGVFERIAPLAFHGVLRDSQDVRGLFNHNPDWVLGRTGAGTMRLAVDSRGLRYEIDIDSDDAVAGHIARAVERGDIDGSSFSFTIESDTWAYDPARKADIRIIQSVEKLFDTGPVTYPAYRATTCVAARGDSSLSLIEQFPKRENALRECEISQKHGANLFRRKSRTSLAARTVIEPGRAAQDDSAEYCRKRRWQLCFG